MAPLEDLSVVQSVYLRSCWHNVLAVGWGCKIWVSQELTRHHCSCVSCACWQDTHSNIQVSPGMEREDQHGQAPMQTSFSAE